MADLRVPTRFREPLLALARLPEKDRDALARSFHEAEAFADPVELARRVADSTTLSESVAVAVISALLSLSIQLTWRSPAERLAEDVARSEDLDLESDERSALEGLLEHLLDTRALRTAAKGSDLATEHQNVFASMRVLTDIRPVFGADPSELPDGVVITSTLKVRYFTDGEERALYLAADELDLETLRAQIDRATAKIATAKNMLRTLALPVYSIADPEPDEGEESADTV